jgi:hypothetical protein
MQRFEHADLQKLLPKSQPTVSLDKVRAGESSSLASDEIEIEDQGDRRLRTGYLISDLPTRTLEHIKLRLSCHSSKDSKIFNRNLNPREWPIQPATIFCSRL